jgi:hypothetical protein
MLRRFDNIGCAGIGCANVRILYVGCFSAPYLPYIMLNLFQHPPESFGPLFAHARHLRQPINYSGNQPLTQKPTTHPINYSPKYQPPT